MVQPDRQPIYGPIESRIDRAKLHVEGNNNLFSPYYRHGLPPTLEDQELTYFGAIYPMHLGVDSPIHPKILPALGLVRGIIERHESGENVQVKEFGQSLEKGGHFSGHRIFWERQRDSLVRLYQLDREFIDRALDFEAVKEKTPQAAR